MFFGISRLIHPHQMPALLYTLNRVALLLHKYRPDIPAVSKHRPRLRAKCHSRTAASTKKGEMKFGNSGSRHMIMREAQPALCGCHIASEANATCSKAIPKQGGPHHPCQPEENGEHAHTRAQRHRRRSARANTRPQTSCRRGHPGCAACAPSQCPTAQHCPAV